MPVSAGKLWSAQMPTVERAKDTGDYPVLAAMADVIFHAGWDEGFALGLQHLLDGITSPRLDAAPFHRS